MRRWQIWFSLSSWHNDPFYDAAQPERDTGPCSHLTVIISLSLVFRVYNHVYNYQMIDSEFPLCFITPRIMEYSRTSIFRALIVREFGFYATAALEPHILTFLYVSMPSYSQ